MIILKCRQVRRSLGRSLVGAGVVILSLATVAGEPFAVALSNPSFAEPMVGNAPSGWGRYAGAGEAQSLTVVEPPFGKGLALLLRDADPNAEIGIEQEVPTAGGFAYEAAVDIAAVDAEPDPVNVYLQIRFLPSNTYVQRDLSTPSRGAFERVALTGVMPDTDTSVRLYLYTHKGTGTSIFMDNVTLVGGVSPPPAAYVAPPPKAPQPSVLKELCLETRWVVGGQVQGVIVVPPAGLYRAAAREIQDAVREVTGSVTPIVEDSAAAAALPLTVPVILLGNRSTNRTLNGLYDASYTLLDLKYPGHEGAVVRSLHNPYANGINAILVGGSDDGGVARAGSMLSATLRAQPKGDALTLGRLMDIRLGTDGAVPTDLTAFETWDASDNYGSVGYFGWNSLSKRMAMYYMTGDAFHAEEFLRLAFPDQQALREINDIDGERIENKDDPLAGAYHYNQHMMILYWDLIEESPVFTDEQRLRITQSLARQLEHEDFARQGIYGLRGPATAVSSRHGQWAAVSLYCLGRYFQAYYPDPVWEHCLRAAAFSFQSLHKHALVDGESDNLFWYSTGIAPILAYLCLSGDRVPIENGVLAELLRGQEILLNGLKGDAQLSSAALSFLNQAAYLTGDGRWIGYRQRTRMSTDVFRLGQSFWPPPELQPAVPTDLCGTWSIQRLPRSLWGSRGSGISHEQSFLFGSFRTEPEAGGDFVLLDGFNGASRNPYHTFDILALRLAGTTVLQGYLNQVLTKADGMVEPAVPMDAALLTSERLGETATAAGRVANAAFCDWKRTLMLRLGTYALLVDDLTFRGDSRNMAVNTLWETQGGVWLPSVDHAVIKGNHLAPVPPGWLDLPALKAACTSVPDEPGMIVYLNSLNIALLRARGPGAVLSVPFHLDGPFTGNVFMDTIRYVDRGVVRIFIDDQVVHERVSLHADDVVRDRVALGHRTLAAGDHVLRLEVTDRHEGVATCYAAIAGLALQPDGLADVGDTAADLVFKLGTSDPLDASGQGVISMKWEGSVRDGEHGIFFHLLSLESRAEAGSTVLRLAPNAAFLRLPAAIACVGSYDHTVAELAIVGTDHIVGRGLTAVGLGNPFLSASKPIAIDWDIRRGTLAMRADEAVRLTFADLESGAMTLDGMALVPGPVDVSAGTHTMGGIRLSEACQSRLRDHLEASRKQGLEVWEKAASEQQTRPGTAALPPLPTQPLAAFQHAVSDMVLLPNGGTPLLAVAEDRTVHLLTNAGQPVATLELEGLVRVLRWWPEAEALLVAGADDKLVAFGIDGTRKWEFTSVMDPAVFRAAKTYWFKTAPGHEGIHGLTTGPFIDGKPQCIIGSACTAEILNVDGSLAQRLPVFWGPGKLLTIVPNPDGSHDALIARWPNGTDQISIINSKTLNVAHGFYGVPAGHTMVGGWSAQNRVDMIWRDIDADGTPEFISATNGRWNRVTVFSNSGRPLHNAQFGPGQGNGFRAYLRDLKTADPDGDGRYTIYTATHEKLVVALDPTCQKQWSTRLPSAPCRLQPCGEKNESVLVGCDDGTLVTLAAESGEITATGRCGGRPEHILGLPDGRLVVGTARGEVCILTLP